MRQVGKDRDLRPDQHGDTVISAQAERVQSQHIQTNPLRFALEQVELGLEPGIRGVVREQRLAHNLQRGEPGTKALNQTDAL